MAKQRGSMNKKFYTAIFIWLTLALGIINGNGAPAGGLDTTFGTNGVTLTQLLGFSHFIHAIAIQPDGKVIAVGEGGSMPVVRYNVNGTLDSSFNGGIAQQTGGSANAV